MVALDEERVWPKVGEELSAIGQRRSPGRAGQPDETTSGGTQTLLPASTTRHLPMLQLVLVNLTAFALVAAAYHRGWLALVIEADSTGICIAIFGAFTLGLIICAAKVGTISRELNDLHGDDPGQGLWASRYLKEIAGRSAGSRAITASALRMRIGENIVVVRYIANSLVLLGLIGTVLGFIIALTAVDPGSASDVRAIEPMVTRLLQGMSVALYTTLVGAVLNLWLTINYRLLASGSAKLASELIALGEAHERPGLA